eukprot:scaffold327_cov257-Pinguiococcus_pyrenoidosus.AAC.1
MASAAEAACCAALIRDAPVDERAETDTADLGPDTIGLVDAVRLCSAAFVGDPDPKPPTITGWAACVGDLCKPAWLLLTSRHCCLKYRGISELDKSL